MRSPISMRRAAAALLLGAVAAPAWAAPGDWTYQTGSVLSQRYSPLDQIAPANLSDLKLAWSAPAVAPAITRAFPDLAPSPYNRGTPILANGMLYVPDELGYVEALDPATGAVQWVQQPGPATLKEAAGQSSRGVAFWQSGDDARVVSVRGQFLYALDAKTGMPAAGFGDEGKVFLRWPTEMPVGGYIDSAGPIVVGDVIVVGGIGGAVDGGGYGDSGRKREGYPENIRGYDVRTGHLLWTFHLIPGEGQPGHDTWAGDSARIVGNMGAWAPISADPALGMVYVPLSAPTLSYFGGHRAGNNQWADSVVALDAKTGKLVWGRQLVHHDLWDYDTASPPVLGTITVKGRTIDALIQLNKTGMIYVLDRKTGDAVWPIVEMPVPQSTVPGEHTSPTQPFSTQFPPVSPTEVTEAELTAFTPAMHAEAVAAVSHFVTGPLFTPPSLADFSPGGKRGSLILPGVWGSGNWNSTAFDPETGVFYAVARKRADIYGLFKPADADATTPFTIVNQGYPDAAAPDPLKPGLPNPFALKNGVPLLRPPYGTISAYDINAGKRMWVAPNGDDPQTRANPALAGVKLPPLLGNIGRGAPLVTKTVLFLADASDAVSGGAGIKGAAALRAYDKRSGAVIWTTPLPAGATGAPMTYLWQGRQYVLVPTGDKTAGGQWLAYALKPKS